MTKPLRLALLISGGGTTASAIIQACRNGVLLIEPVVVIASSGSISGISRVQEAGYPRESIEIIDPTGFADRKEFADALVAACEKYSVDLVGQYGWLPLTPRKLIEKYEGRIINQHPGPLDPPSGPPAGGDFGGKGMWGRRVHAAVLHFRRETNHDFWTEATTHLVTAEFDKGEVIKRKKVEIHPEDTVEDLQKRVLPVEYEVQIAALSDFANDSVTISKREKPLIRPEEVSILEAAKLKTGLEYPEG